MATGELMSPPRSESVPKEIADAVDDVRSMCARVESLFDGTFCVATGITVFGVPVFEVSSRLKKRQAESSR